MPLPVTHKLVDEDSDDILQFLVRRNLLNRKEDKVKLYIIRILSILPTPCLEWITASLYAVVIWEFFQAITNRGVHTIGMYGQWGACCYQRFKWFW